MTKRDEGRMTQIGVRFDDATPADRQGGTESDPEAAIVGVGNRLLQDDGVGPRVVDLLEASVAAPPEALRLYDAGTTGFFALEAMSGCERAIVVDAIQTDQDPGTVQEYRFTDGGFDEEVPQVTMHDISFTEALTFARDVYDLPDTVRIIGVEPGSLGTGLALTDPVQEAIPAVLDRIASYEPTIEPDELAAVDPTSMSTTGPNERPETGLVQSQNDTPTPAFHEVSDR